MTTAEPISLIEIQEAQNRLSDTVYRTPLVPLNADNSPAEILLKLENLQPIGRKAFGLSVQEIGRKELPGMLGY
jgi:threonine dehydratase